MSDSAFNVNQELASMRQEIADRSFRIQRNSALIMVGLGALALGAFFVFPTALGAAAPFVGLLAAAGSAIAGFVTLKEREKLNIDREYLETRMQGGNWWRGYREHVVEPGHSEPQPPLHIMGGSKNHPGRG